MDTILWKKNDLISKTISDTKYALRLHLPEKYETKLEVVNNQNGPLKLIDSFR